MALFKPRSAVQRTIAEHLRDHMRGINELFPAGAKLTLIIRTEALEQPLILSNDDQAEAVKAMHEMMPGKGGILLHS